MWETICDAQAGFCTLSSNSKFVSKFSREPLSGISDQRAPPPPKWNSGRSCHFEYFQFWLQSTPLQEAQNLGDRMRRLISVSPVDTFSFIISCKDLSKIPLNSELRSTHFQFKMCGLYVKLAGRPLRQRASLMLFYSTKFPYPLLNGGHTGSSGFWSLNSQHVPHCCHANVHTKWRCLDLSPPRRCWSTRKQPPPPTLENIFATNNLLKSR